MLLRRRRIPVAGDNTAAGRRLKLHVIQAPAVVHPEAQVRRDDPHGGDRPAELQVGHRHRPPRRLLRHARHCAPHRGAPLHLHAAAAADRHERRHPQREAHDHEPHALEQHRRRPNHRHGEAPRQDGAGGGGDDGRRHHQLQQPVVVALEARVVRGVEPEQEQLLPEHRRGERGHHVPDPRAAGRRGGVTAPGGDVGGERHRRVHGEVEVHGGVLEAVRVEAEREDGEVDELVGDGEHGEGEHEVELQVPQARQRRRREREPGGGAEAGGAVELVALDGVQHVPHAEDGEGQAGQDVP